MKEITQDGWISVHHSLPKLGEIVRCKLPKSCTPFKQGWRDLYRMKHNGKWNDYDNAVTHWQPLPSPPIK